MPVILLNIYESDRIIKILKDRYPEEWRKAGTPCGYFWIPKETDLTWWERDRITMKLPFWWVKIEWIERDNEAKERRKRIILITPIIWVLWLTAMSTGLTLWIQN